VTHGQGSSVRVVLTTLPSAEAAETLGASLVEERLAACTSVVPGVTSIYRWEGELRRDAEALLVIKTTADGVAALTGRLVELHPYDVPEVLALPVGEGHAPYLDWVRSEVSAP